MKKYTVDVRVVYVQTIEVTADSASEAIATACDLFEVNDATPVTLSGVVGYREDLPATEGEVEYGDDTYDDEPSICSACNGSGEGFADGTTCSKCKGKGETL